MFVCMCVSWGHLDVWGEWLATKDLRGGMLDTNILLLQVKS